MVIVSVTGPENVSQAEVERRREVRLARTNGQASRGGVTKSAGKKPRHSPTDAMETDAEKLWSAKERGLIAFEDIPPMLGIPFMPAGGVGISPGTRGVQAFWAYIRRPKVIARLEAEGFVPSAGAPHPWHQISGRPGIVSPAESICRKLTLEQREQIEANRLAALIRKQFVCATRSPPTGGPLVSIK